MPKVPGAPVPHIRWDKLAVAIVFLQIDKDVHIVVSVGFHPQMGLKVAGQLGIFLEFDLEIADAVLSVVDGLCFDTGQLGGKRPFVASGTAWYTRCGEGNSLSGRSADIVVVHVHNVKPHLGVFSQRLWMSLR
jgi:hypothetical protein